MFKIPLGHKICRLTCCWQLSSIERILKRSRLSLQWLLSPTLSPKTKRLALFCSFVFVQIRNHHRYHPFRLKLFFFSFPRIDQGWYTRPKREQERLYIETLLYLLYTETLKERLKGRKGSVTLHHHALAIGISIIHWICIPVLCNPPVPQYYNFFFCFYVRSVPAFDVQLDCDRSGNLSEQKSQGSKERLPEKEKEKEKKGCSCSNTSLRAETNFFPF